MALSLRDNHLTFKSRRIKSPKGAFDDEIMAFNPKENMLLKEGKKDANLDIFKGMRIPHLPNKKNECKQNYSVKLRQKESLIFIADDNQTF